MKSKELASGPDDEAGSPPEERATQDDATGGKTQEGVDDGRIDISLDGRFYRVRIPRATGIEWGTDLSFSFVYVRDMDPSGSAAISGEVDKGDQLCELIAVAPDAEPLNLLGASFDAVMSSFANLDRSVKDVDLVFFKGTKDELKAVCTGEESGESSEDITVTVIVSKGTTEEKVVEIPAKAGANVRELLLENGINVYQSVTRWTNCKGKQLCGTCIVNVPRGGPNTNWKSMDEASTLRSNPDSYRLSCITFAHGDLTGETYPPVNKDQWTR